MGNGEITLSFTDVGKPGPSRYFLRYNYVIKKFSRKFANLQYLLNDIYSVNYCNNQVSRQIIKYK